MIRDRLVAWLLSSRLLCLLGLHMPVKGCEFKDDGELHLDARFHCAVCGREL